MRKTLGEKLEVGRVHSGYYASRPGDLHGSFNIIGPNGQALLILSSGSDTDAEGWEHVSVSTKHRTPNWAEMCFVKDLFWDDEETVMQLHPPRSSYINNHPYCLHLWRPTGDVTLPVPPAIFVGHKALNDACHKALNDA